MMYDLPTSLEIDGVNFDIRSDYRAALDASAALSNNEFTDNEKAIALLRIIYVDYELLTDYEEAVKKALWFLSCGREEEKRPQPKLMDWEKDFHYIVAPINKMLCKEIRSIEYMHWWTFISYYMEIDNKCMFSSIVNIREKKATGKKLEKHEKDFYNKNRSDIDLTTRMSNEEKDLILSMIGG